MLVQANTIYPEQQRQWFTDVSDQVQGSRPARGDVRDVRLAQRRADEDPDVGAVRPGPRRLLPRHHVHPDRLRDRGVPGAHAPTTGASSAAGTGSCRRPSASPGPTRTTRSASRSPAARSSWPTTRTCSRPPASTSPPTAGTACSTQAKKLTVGRHLRARRRLRRRLRPVEVHLGDERPGRQPPGQGQEGAARPTRATLKAYQTYLGWLATDKVVDPAAVGWKNAQAIATSAPARPAFLPMVSATSKVTLDKSAGRRQVRLRASCRRSRRAQTSKPAGGVGATQHPVRRQPRRGEVHQEQGPRPRPGQAADQRRAAGVLLQDVRRDADQRGRPPRSCRPTRRSRRSSTRRRRPAAPRSTARGARSSWPWSTWSSSRSPPLKDGKLDEATLEALIADGPDRPRRPPWTR